jgi:HEPN superfamily protein
MSLPAEVALAAVRADLGRAQAALAEAEGSDRPAPRYLAAQLAALRTAAVVLALRGPTGRPSRSGGPRNAWRLLAEVAPELGEWAAFFDTTQARRDAVRGGAWVSAREADDLLRDAQAFLGLIERVLAPVLRDRRPAPPG